MNNSLAPVPWIYSPVKLKVHPINDDRMTVCYFNSYESEANISERNSFGYLIAAAPDLLDALLNLIGAIDSPVRRRKMPSEFIDQSLQIAKAAINKSLNK